MKIFRDEECKEEISTLDLGTVKVGDTQKYTFYVYNEQLPELIELEFSIDSKEVKIIEAPLTLKTRESGKLIIEYIPEVTLKQGLRAQISVKGNELYK